MASRSRQDLTNQQKYYRYQSKSGNKSRHRKVENESELSSRSHSVEPLKEKKLLNVGSSYEAFLSISEAFENILDELEIDDNCKEVHDKLFRIESLIKEKIDYFKHRIKKNRDLGLPRSLASSLQSLNSVKSELDDNLAENSSWKEFLIRVDCPFCLESLPDKINLIKHLDESCKPYMLKKFEESKEIPFSIFQILPNNTFKCNICPNSVKRTIKQYFAHSLALSHIHSYERAACTKYYSEYVFCSCCKVQVPNNFTELEFHIGHIVHKNYSDTSSSVEDYLKRGIHCVYYKGKKFKCIICPHSVWDSLKEILKHIEDPKHIKNSKNYNYCAAVLYCEFCSKEVHIFEIINHFKEEKHKRQEKNLALEQNFKLCFYCGFLCNNLMVLSNHMQSLCQAIENIRKKNLKSAKIKEENLQKTTKISENKVKEDSKEENTITVKGDWSLVKLYKCFKEFGEIISLRNEKNSAKIKFKEKEAVEGVLLLQDCLEIDGVNLKITTSENVSESNIQSSEASGGDQSLDDKKISPADTEDEHDIGNSVRFKDDYKLQNLFQRVSFHLQKNDDGLHPALIKKLIRDFGNALQSSACELVGFSACKLSFPVESIRLNCELELTNTLKSDIILRFQQSDLWENIKFLSGIYEYITSVHKETRKSCTITCGKFASSLTNMLKNCLKYNNVRSFCLIVRFWLSVHELEIAKYEYVIISILIFFLINGGYAEISDNDCTFFDVNLLENSVKEKKVLTKRNSYKIEVKDMFQNFLVFLHFFNFDKYAICLPFKYPVPKEMIKNEKLFEKNVYSIEQLEKSPMFILDPLKMKNLAALVPIQAKNSLLKVVKDTVEYYKVQ